MSIPRAVGFWIKTISVRFSYDIVLDCRSQLEFQPRNMTMNWKGKLLIKHVKMFCTSLNVATRELILYNFWISASANHLLSQGIEGVQKRRLEKLGRLPWLELRKAPSTFLSYLMYNVMQVVINISYTLRLKRNFSGKKISLWTLILNMIFITIVI